jgi:hypothetical protein
VGDVISVIVGVIAVVFVLAWLAMNLGVGEHALDWLAGLFGAPAIRLSRRINAARRRRSIAKLPPDVPPPPESF